MQAGAIPWIAIRRLSRVQFTATGHRAFCAARENLGREISTDWFLQDIRPYEMA